MHILILQHARVETAGSLGQFLKEDGHTSEVVHLDEGEKLPENSNFDGLWVLGDWLLVIGYGLWIMVYWLLVMVYWLLVIGYCRFQRFRLRDQFDWFGSICVQFSVHV